MGLPGCRALWFGYCFLRWGLGVNFVVVWPVGVLYLWLYTACLAFPVARLRCCIHCAKVGACVKSRPKV